MNPAQRVRIASAITLLTLSIVPASPGADGTWDSTAGGTWSDPLNWLNGIVADDVGAIANFNQQNITEDRLITLDSDRIIGTITFADLTTQSHIQTIGSDNDSVLTLATLAGKPLLNVTNNSTLILAAAIAGTQGFERIGPGNVILANPANTFTGDINIGNPTTNAAIDLTLGASGVIPDANLVTIGGSAGTMQLVLNGFEETIGGLVSASAGTRRVIGNHASNLSVLTIENAPGATSLYAGQVGSNIAATPNQNRLSVVKAGAGLQEFTNVSALGATTAAGLGYYGDTVIKDGALGFGAIAGVVNGASSSLLVFDGGVFQSTAAGTFTRSLGTTAGSYLAASTSFYMTANGGGWSAKGGVLTVNLGGAAEAVNWGENAGTELVGPLKFGHASSNNQVVFTNPLVLNGAQRSIQVADNPGSANDLTVLSGVLSDGIGGPGSLVKSGAGLLVLSADNSFAGGITINDGTVRLGSGGTTGNAGTGPISVGAGGTLQITRSDDVTSGGVTVSNAISGPGSLSINGTGAIVLTGSASTLSGPAEFGNGVNSNWNGATGNKNGFVVLAGPNALGTGLLTSRGGQLQAAIPGLTLANDIEIQPGGLRFGGSNDLTLSGNLKAVGALRGIGNYSTNRALTVDGNIDIDGTGLALEAIVGAATPANGTIVVNGTIFGSGNVNIVDITNGLVVLNAANSYSGGTTLNTGTTRIGQNDSLGTGLVTFTGSAALTSTDASARTVANAINFTGAGSFGDAVNSGDLTFTGPVTFNAAARTMNVRSQTTFTGAMSNGGLGQKQGTGTLRILGDDNPLTTEIDWSLGGAIQVMGGILSIDAATVVNRDAVRVMASDAASPAARFELINGSSVLINLTGANLRIGHEASAITDGINIADIAGTLTLQSSGTGGFVQMGSNSSVARLNLKTGGLIELKGIGIPGNGNPAAASREFNFDGGTLRALVSTGTFINNLSTAVIQAGGGTIDSNGFDLTVPQPLLHDLTLGATPDGGLTKVGAGTLTLSAFNTYTGDTRIDGGAVLVTGSLSGSAVKVNAGLLGGSGFTLDVFVGNGNGLADAVLAPGTSIGTLNTGNVSFDSDAAFALEIDSGFLASDLLLSVDTVNLGLGIAALNVTDLGNTMLGNGERFDFIAAASVLGEFAGLPNGALIDVGANTFSIEYTSTSVALVAIPEPASMALFLGGLSLLVARRRRA